TQPEPLPETMIGGNALAYLHHKLGGWGTGGMAHIEPAALAEYERCFQKPETIHAVCEDYRASASIDLEHDRTSRAKGDRIACDTLVLWGDRGVVQRLFNPMALWQAQCAAHYAPWHFLYFLPLPHGQGSLRPGSASFRTVSTRGPTLRQSSRRS
ncbi:MAG: hypothetical protein RL081_1252, partial [Pseudomonadota bacterium]